MSKKEALLWQDSLIPLMQGTIQRDPAQYRLYFSMYWGSRRFSHPTAFLRAN